MAIAIPLNMTKKDVWLPSLTGTSRLMGRNFASRPGSRMAWKNAKIIPTPPASRIDPMITDRKYASSQGRACGVVIVVSLRKMELIVYLPTPAQRDGDG